MIRARGLGFLVVPFCAIAALGQEPAEPVIRSSVHEVLLDAVVRQKNMQLARKLKASDFQVWEDGVPQQIRTFRLVSGDETALEPSPAPAASEGGRKPAPGNKKLLEPSFVSLVFEQIGPHTREYAREAAAQFLKQEMRSNTFVALFGLNYRLNLIANFTADRAVLAKAVDRAVMSDYSHLSRDLSSILNQSAYTVSGSYEQQGASITNSIDLSKSPDLAMSDASTPDQTDGAMAAAKIIADQRDVAMYQGGMRSLMALQRLVQYESTLPGRKTVIYLSEGLNLPPGQKDFLLSVIAAANRGRVAFYAVDVRGLMMQSGSAMSRQLLTGVAATSRSQANGLAVTKSQAVQDDTVQEAMVADNQLNMDELARGTGGFAITNTNEIGKAMSRVMQDVRTHYELSYVPTSEVFDGHFRRIEVRVRNPKLTVQSREGYFALPDLNGKMLEPFEMPALAALDAKPRPRAFAFTAAALQFRPTPTGFRYEIGFDMPTANITPEANVVTHRVRLHAAFVALIKDAHGQVIEKVSRDLDRDVPEDKLAQFRQGEMIVTAPVELAPGRYTLEAAALDPKGNRSSVRRAVLVVSAPGPVAVSDVAVVRDLVPLTEPRDPDNPLEFTGGRVTPNLSQTGNSAGDTSLYFVIYPARGARPRVSIQFYRDGELVARNQPELGEADGAGIPVIASSRLPAGDYEARVTVDQGGRISRRATAFRVGE